MSGDGAGRARAGRARRRLARAALLAAVVLACGGCGWIGGDGATTTAPSTPATTDGGGAASRAADHCPRTRGRMSFLLSERYGTNLALGDGPVYPSIMGDRPGQRTGYGLARLTRGAAGGDGRYPLKMLWIRAPSYRGPASVRGTNTGTGQTVAWMIASPQELQLPAGGRRGFREWVTTAMLPGPGCYRLDVRGSTFHDTISFRATFE